MDIFNNVIMNHTWIKITDGEQKHHNDRYYNKECNALFRRMVVYYTLEEHDRYIILNKIVLSNECVHCFLHFRTMIFHLEDQNKNIILLERDYLSNNMYSLKIKKYVTRTIYHRYRGRCT